MSNEQVSDSAENARADWQSRSGRQRGNQGAGLTAPRPPGWLRATPGRGQVSLDWEPVAGAIGYLVHRSDDADGPFLPIDHLGGDVLAVPHPPYADTTGEAGRTYHYAVAPLADIGVVGPIGEAVEAASALDGDALVRVGVDASRSTGTLARPWAPMIGAEHLSHLLCTDTTGGRPIGEELTAALATARDELGVATVRAHAILCDDVGVYREVDGEPVYDFTRVDQIYDHLLGLGLRPIVELSFMPADLALDPSRTVFAYRAIISPPKDWGRWKDLISGLVGHLVERYGLDEVRQWAFEVWNEANLDVFWSGAKDEYLRLYEEAARAVKEVDASLKVGGPGSAAAGWNGDLLEYAAKTGAPIDFISTHTYGSPPLDFRPLCAEYGRSDLELLWTEWGVTPTHFNPINDDVFSAAFLLRGMRSAAERIEALAYWVVSDHFEELGRPPRLFHGGFGLLSVGNLRKPRYWALAALHSLGDRELRASVNGDGANSLVEAWSAGHEDGRISLLVWNGTLDQSKREDTLELERLVQVQFKGLTHSAYQICHSRIDSVHSNIRAVWEEHGGGDWPDEAQWDLLHEANILESYEPDRTATPDNGRLTHAFFLPMPGISMIELTPVE